MKRFFPVLLLIALLAAGLGGCGREEPLFPRLGPGTVILAFGDSLTFGTGARPEESYPERLAAFLGCRVVNRGVPGEETGEGAARIESVLDEVAPDILVLIHGGNDFLRRRPRELTRRNLEAMITSAQKRGIAVLLVAVPLFGLPLRPPDLYRDLARKLNVPLLEETLADILSERPLKSDHVHPNAQGYERLAREIAVFLRRHSRE